MPDIFTHSHKSMDGSSKPATIDLPNSKPNLFSSYSIKPLGIVFQNQEENEEILLFLRPHFITNVSWILTSLFLISIPLLIFYIFPFISSSVPFTLPDRYIIILLLFYYLLIIGYILVNFMGWFYNIFIVTQVRVVDINYSDLVYHNVAMTKLDLAQDVDYTQTGFIRSLFNYGDILMQTSGKNAIFHALAVPNPSQAVEIIEDLIGKEGTSVP